MALAFRTHLSAGCRLLLLTPLLCLSGVHADTPAIERGSITPRLDNQDAIPSLYRLPKDAFTFELAPRRDLPNSGFELSALRFPSAVTTATPENNTVHAEYYRPKGPGPFPGVIILDITGGDQSLSRTIARSFAQNQIAGLFVQMAYYGPRRPPGSKLRLLSTNLPRTFDAIRQTVLDVRRAAAWLESRPEIDARRLGLHGTSLGSIIGALAAEMEPKLSRVCILLGGGGLVEAFYEHPQAAPYRKMWETLGGTKDQVLKGFAPYDPLTRADLLKGRKVLFIAGKRDEIVPPAATERLWKGAGEPRILWYDCTHYGAALFFGTIMKQVIEHFNQS